MTFTLRPRMISNKRARKAAAAAAVRSPEPPAPDPLAADPEAQARRRVRLAALGLSGLRDYDSEAVAHHISNRQRQR